MRSAALIVPALLFVPFASGCTEANNSAEAGDDRLFQVTSTNDECTLSGTEASAGTLTFRVKNDGDQITEFYLLAEDGLRIVGEVENIGPGLTRDLVVNTQAGDYVTACKPGMKGAGIRGDFSATGTAEAVSSVADDEVVAQASANYAAYVRDQSAQLLEKTEQFVADYVAGRDEQARTMYPDARTHWERIETVAESFGDLDPRMDAREADLEPGEKWSGWHLLEKDLWPQRATDYTALTDAQRKTYADQLLQDTRTLERRVQKMEFDIVEIANGARGLLDEVATGKVTGEEEYWSRTDLWDFQANVDGARIAFEGVQQVVAKNEPELDTSISRRFAELQKLLDAQRQGDGFRSYDELDPAEVRQLSDAVNALSEPLSRLPGAVA